MFLFLILLFSIIFAGLAWKRPVLAIQLTLFALPLYLIRFNFVIPMTLLEVMILINFGVWFFKEWRGLLGGLKNRFKKTDTRVVEYPFALEMMAILVLSFVAVGVAGFSNEAMGSWKAYFFEPLLLLLVIYNVFGPARHAGLNPESIGSQGEWIPDPMPTGRQEVRDDGLTNRLGLIIRPLAYSALAVGVLAAYQKFTGDLIGNPLWAAEKTRRVVSVFGYPNAVGLYVESIIFLSLGLMISKFKTNNKSLIFNSQFTIFNKFSMSQIGNSKISHSLKIFALKAYPNWRVNWSLIILTLSIIFSSLSIVFAKSNGAALGVVSGLIVFALFASKISRRAIIVFLLFCSLVIASITPMRNKAIEYLTLQDFSGQVRIVGWTESWNMLKDGRLLTGAGLSNFQKTVTPYHVPGFYFNKDKDPDFHRKLVIFNQEYRNKFWQPLEVYMYPHNIILNFWSELGLLGMLAFVWLIARALYLGLKMYYSMVSGDPSKWLLIATISALVTTIIHGLVDVPYFKNDLAILFWLLIGLVGLFKLNRQTDRP